MKEFGPDATEETVTAELKKCQQVLHSSGATNSVLFDPDTERFHGLDRRRKYGPDFRILGVLFDTQLLMTAAAKDVAREAGW